MLTHNLQKMVIFTTPATVWMVVKGEAKTRLTYNRRIIDSSELEGTFKSYLV